jgi:hypothetical protein
LGSYPVGQKIRLAAQIKDNSLAFVDPTVLTVKIQQPDGTETSHVYGVDNNVIKDSTGNYHYDFVLNAPGRWPWRFEATGNMSVPFEGVATALPSDFYPL